MSSARVLGVHPVAAPQPVHLVEIDLGEGASNFDWSSVTQPLEGRDSSYWQVPYDERAVPGKEGRWCFFFHYLNLQSPLHSNFGPLPLPSESPLPPHLRFIQYEEPC